MDGLDEMWDGIIRDAETKAGRPLPGARRMVALLRKQNPIIAAAEWSKGSLPNGFSPNAETSNPGGRNG